MFVLYSCKTSQHASPEQRDNTSSVDEVDASNQETNNDLSLIEANCQFDDRKNAGEIINTAGKIILSVRVYMIELEDGQRFYPCNLPVKYRKEELRVVISGNIKQVKPNERWGGKPFQITSIQTQASKK
tara:strand:+ start:426 stop:812 length:387 start_codon:yes stop_codon:yes gene_type:complete